MPFTRGFNCARQVLHPGVIDLERNSAANRHLARMAQQAKTGDVGNSMNRA